MLPTEGCEDTLCFVNFLAIFVLHAPS